MTPSLNLYLSHDNPGRGLKVEAKLRDTLHDLSADIFITSGRGDADRGNLSENWNPRDHDLIVLVLSTPEKEREPDWYRLQSELQTITYARAQKRTLMYIQENTIRAADDIYPSVFPTARKVLGNIIERGKWTEYTDDDGLCELIKREVIHWIDAKTDSSDDHSPEISQAPAGSWLITLDQAIQTKIGARWVERGDHLAIDTSGTESDSSVALEHITAQLHEKITQTAKEFLPIATRLNNSMGWQGISETARRFFEAIDVQTVNLPRNLGSAYNAILELASFLEQDTELQQQPASAAFPLDPEVRRPLRVLIRTAAPWLRRFPTVRELDDECGAFLTRPELLEPAASVLEIARIKRLVSDVDADATHGVLNAAHRGKFQGNKAGVRGLHTVRNLVIASATIVATFLSSAVSSDFATKSDLVKHAGSSLAAAAEEYISKLTVGMQDDIRIALVELLKELKKYMTLL
jgi:hypothetical protein